MDPYLITMTIHERVEATPDKIVRLRVDLRDHKRRALVLGRKGNIYPVEHEDRFNGQQLLAAAKEGLLYAERHIGVKAFAASLDEGTDLPLLMEEYQTAFRRRQLDNSLPVQQQLNLKAST